MCLGEYIHAELDLSRCSFGRLKNLEVFNFSLIYGEFGGATGRKPPPKNYLLCCKGVNLNSVRIAVDQWWRSLELDLLNEAMVGLKYFNFGLI